MRNIFISMLAVAMMSGTASAYTTTKSETLKVWFDPVTLVADGTTVTKMTVYENDHLNYSAFNMAFIVPKGIHIAMVKKGRDLVEDIDLTARAAATHSIACNMLADGETIKVIADSSMLDDFYPDDEDGNPMDALYTIGLTADPDMEDGTYTVQMLDIKFVLATADACVPIEQPVLGTFTITGGVVTAIDEVECDTAEDEPYYDLFGRIVNGTPAPGIYIHNGRNVAVK